MTLWAYKTDQNIVEVSATSGSLAVKVTEDPRHLRSFWARLGEVLDEVEKPAEPEGQAG